jgi:putative thiamine transport system substrate-binding protein
MLRYPIALGLALLLAAPTAEVTAGSWETTLARARGQTVYWNAWAGDEQINAYIAWIGGRVRERFGIELVHVKVADTAETVTRVVAEKAAGREKGGSVDLIWINGENFAAMKRQNLLFGPFAEDLPNFRLVDTEGKPTTLIDFTVPTEGYESPWGSSQFVLIYDSAAVSELPRSIPALLEWAAAHPGRLTYPAPPDFLGTTFLKHVLLELTPNPEVLQRPVEEADFHAVSAPMWRWLKEAKPHLWRGGASYPASGPAQEQLLYDGEVDFAMAFHPGAATAGIEAGSLPKSARTFILEKGTIGNTHFVAIPFNAAHREGAMVVADFLLSPEAQAKKQDPRVWGDGTVLDLDKLSEEQRALFEALPLGIATLPPEELIPVRPEPHPSWTTEIEAEWLRRFSR